METFFQKPREEWTELEKRAFEEVQNICNRHDGDAEARYGAWEAMVWLSSQLPIKSNWKPSEEQIYSLGTVVKGYNECTVGSVGYHLKEMYEHLKKLI